MNTITIEDILKLEPCEEGVDFLNQFSSPKEAWEACEDPDHMFWALRNLNLIPEETSVTLANIFAERAKKFAESADAAASRSAAAASRAAASAAYWATRAAEYAADAAASAAYWAADAAKADAYKKERIEQCKIIREHVNPFKD
jgi:uncharacterized cupin superfamily protein